MVCSDFRLRTIAQQMLPARRSIASTKAACLYTGTFITGDSSTLRRSHTPRLCGFQVIRGQLVRAKERAGVAEYTVVKLSPTV